MSLEWQIILGWATLIVPSMAIGYWLAWCEVRDYERERE